MLIVAHFCQVCGIEIRWRLTRSVFFVNPLWFQVYLLYLHSSIAYASLRFKQQYVPWAKGGGMIFVGKNNSISYLFRESWNLGNFIDVTLWVSQPMPVLIARAWLISSVTGTSEDLKIQEKSHDSRFFCVLRSLGVTCKQAWRYSLGAG